MILSHLALSAAAVSLRQRNLLYFFLDISKDSGGQLDLLIVDALYKVSLMQSLTLGFVNHLL